jgi:hypothetical protein
MQGTHDACAVSLAPTLDIRTESHARSLDNMQGTHDARAVSLAPTLDIRTESHARTLDNMQGTRDARDVSYARAPDMQGTHGTRGVSRARTPDLRTEPFDHISDNMQGTHDARAVSLIHTPDIRTGSQVEPVVHLQDNMQDIHDFETPTQYQAPDWDEDAMDDDFAGDVTIIASKGKGREMESDTGSATQSILSELDLQPFRPRVSTYDPIVDHQFNNFLGHQHVVGREDSMKGQSIPSDPSSVMAYYNSSGNVKRDRDDDTESTGSRQSKIYRRSASHSTVPSGGLSVPSTKASTRSVSRSDDGNVSPAGDSDRQGASRTTGAIFRGRAIGNNFNMADAGMCCSILKFSQVFIFFLSSLDEMNEDSEKIHQIPSGKVLLYTSRDDNARPVMSMKHKTIEQLPTILKEVAQKFSPIRSKYMILYYSDNS